MLRSLFSRIVFALLALLPMVAFGQTISFQAQAQPVPQLIKAINAEFGTNYLAHSSMIADIVCVQVSDVELNDLLAKIAEVTSAGWVRRGSVMSLEPSASLRRAEATKEAEFKKSTYERQLRSYERNWDRMGIDKSLAQQLPLLDIAKQTAWTNEVYAVSPTRKQSRLNSKIANLMGTQWMQSGRRNRSSRGITIGQYEDLHIVSRPNANGISLSLEATDVKGAVISSTNIQLRNSTSFPNINVPDTVDPAKVISLTPLSKEFAKLWSLSPQARSSDTPLYVVKAMAINASLRKEIQDIVEDPLAIEPLSVFVSPVLNEAARIEGRNLVALLPDSAIILANYVDQAKTMESTSALRYLRGSVINSRNSGKWTLMTPQFPKQSRADRIDRETLKKLTLDVMQSGALDPVALSEAIPSEAMSRTDMTDGYIGFFDVGVAGAAKAAFSSQYSTYKTLATVPRQYLIEALKGNSVKVENMLGNAMKAATLDIFNRRLSVSQRVTSSSTTSRNSGVTNTVLDLFVTTQPTGQRRQQTSVNRTTRLSPPIEITDLLPTGITGLTIEINTRTSRMIQGRSISRGLVQRASVDQMAGAAANAENGKTSRNTDGLFVCDEYMAVERRFWTITYRMPNGMYASSSVSWIEPDVANGYGPFSNLNSSYVQQYERSLTNARERIQKQNESNNNRRVGSRRIPPPQ